MGFNVRTKINETTARSEQVYSITTDEAAIKPEARNAFRQRNHKCQSSRFSRVRFTGFWKNKGEIIIIFYRPFWSLFFFFFLHVIQNWSFISPQRRMWAGKLMSNLSPQMKRKLDCGLRKKKEWYLYFFWAQHNEYTRKCKTKTNILIKLIQHALICDKFVLIVTFLVYFNLFIACNIKLVSNKCL